MLSATLLAAPASPPRPPPPPCMHSHSKHSRKALPLLHPLQINHYNEARAAIKATIQLGSGACCAAPFTAGFLLSVQKGQQEGQQGWVGAAPRPA